MLERALEDIERKDKLSTKVIPTATNQGILKSTTAFATVRSSEGRSPPYRVSQEVYNYRRANNLCYKCGEKSILLAINVGMRHLIV